MIGFIRLQHGRSFLKLGEPTAVRKIPRGCYGNEEMLLGKMGHAYDELLLLYALAGIWKFREVHTEKNERDGREMFQD